MPKAGHLDLGAKLVLALGAGTAIYLIAVPLAMLVFAALRGPADFLPFESGAHWTLDNIRALFTDPVIATGILPDTFVFVFGTVTLVFVIGSSSAPIFRAAKSGSRSSCFPCSSRRRSSPSRGSS
jgi:iron(III) transport system permease protein